MRWPRCVARCGRRAEPHDLLCARCRADAESALFDQDRNSDADLVAWAKSLMEEDPDE